VSFWSLDMDTQSTEFDMSSITNVTVCIEYMELNCGNSKGKGKR